LADSDSIEYFDKEITKLVDEIDHCGWRARGLLKDGKKEESMKFLDKIKQFEPKLFQFRKQKAEALEKLDRHEEARLLLEKNNNKELY